MSLVDVKPHLVRRPVFGRWKTPVEVADFSEDQRPAYRVVCHCRNCNWKGEARVPVGEKVPLWLDCPKCETFELSAHGEFMGRDEISREQEMVDHRAYLERLRKERIDSDPPVT